MSDRESSRNPRSAGRLTRRLKRLIAGYIEHMHDKSYLATVFAEAPPGEIDVLLADMLRGGDRHEASQADLFVQDAVMFDLSTEFAQYLPRSQSLRALGDNIRSNDYVTRHLCLHTLGRIGPRSNAKYLANAFDWYLENDPFNLDDLLGELFWLKPRLRREPYIDAMISAPQYLDRWAVISHFLDRGSYLGTGPANKRFRPRILDYLRILAQDPHPRVREEALWHLTELQLTDENEIAAEQLIARDACREPRLTFFALELHVSNYPGITGGRDYDFALVERIAAYAEAHPTYPGLDLNAYWGTFASSEPGLSC